jgi:hypothetical protein
VEGIKIKRISTTDLPLHEGKAPYWLVKLMKDLGKEVCTIIIKEYGTEEFLRRILDTFWFQSFGCVLGYDWHSSGVTTVLTGVLKEIFKENDLGIFLAGGKGKRSRKTLEELDELKKFNFDEESISKYKYISRIVAKIDNSLIQAGYQLYHHTIFIDYKGKWAVVQQGMNTEDLTARRYHWLDENVKEFVNEPHTAIVSDVIKEKVLNMVASESEENRKACVDLVNEGVKKIQRSIKECVSGPLDKWLENHGQRKIPHYMMPREINWKALNELYERKPKKYIEIIEFYGVGPSTIRALALVSEIIFGTPASWRDPVKYTFAHGGKDGVPYPINKKTYRKTIEIFRDAIQRANIGDEQKLMALKRLASLEIY